MNQKVQIADGTLSLVKGDITDIDTESFVFYAGDDLAPGSGFGTAINLRGGPSVRKELEALGTISVTNAVATSAGTMKAKYIIHADGPKFQEPEIEKKLEATILSALACAEEKGIARIAFPPMGAGFYGVPIDVSARITTGTLARYLKNGGRIHDITVCAFDTRDYDPCAEELTRFESKGAFHE